MGVKRITSLANSTTGKISDLKFYKDDTDTTGKTLLRTGDLLNNSLEIVDMVFDTTEEKFIVYFTRDRVLRYKTKGNNQVCDSSDKAGCYNSYEFLNYDLLARSCTLVGTLTNCRASLDSNKCRRAVANHGDTSGVCDSGSTGTCSYKCNNGTWELLSDTCPP